MAKQVRTISQKLNDIAEAGWEAGDLHADGDDYGQIGEKAERRIARLGKQLESLALVAIQGKYMLSSARMTEILAAPERDEILAEAVVGNWIAVGDLINTAFFNATHALPISVNALADPLTGHVVTLNPVQTQAEGLTVGESRAAYEAVTRRFGLRAAQRSKLDRAVQYSAVLTAAHQGHWSSVEKLLGHAGIIE